MMCISVLLNLISGTFNNRPKNIFTEIGVNLDPDDRARGGSDEKSLSEMAWEKSGSEGDLLYSVGDTGGCG